MNLSTSKSEPYLMGNITDPADDCLLALWDEPLEYASISVDPKADHILFTVIIEAPDCPRLEIAHAIPGGHA